MSNAFKYVKDKGLSLDEDYPYIAVQNSCKQQGGPFRIDGFMDLEDCASLGNIIQSKVVSVAVDATNWKDYKEGTFKDCAASLKKKEI